MKILCFDLDNCGYAYQIPLEELTDYDLAKPFIKCFECNSLAILVKDDFTLTENNRDHLISSLLKLSKRK
jgi:hypothetical protein